MFQSILVPVDLTDRNQRALETALELARTSGGSVTLLHVIEDIELAEPDEVRSFYEQLERRAHDRLAALEQPFESAGVPVEALVLVGHRTEEIVRHAEARAYDLLVLTSHRVDLDRKGEGWGTISYQVAILSTRPVLLVK